MALTDQGGNIANTYAYQPFGEMTQGQTQTITQPFTYVGQYGVMAEGYGYYYMRARYYDSGTGRFVSEDPLVFGGGDVNLYAYVKGNPVNGVDPLGLCTSSTNRLTWGKAMWHYFFGEGQDISISIKEVYHGEPVTFNSKNRAGFDTNGPVGRIVLERQEYGNIVALPDRFDFDPRPWGERDPRGFPYPKEVSTRIGEKLPGQPFYTRFEGQVTPAN